MQRTAVFAAARQNYFCIRFLFVLGQVKVRRPHSRQKGEVFEVLLFCGLISRNIQHPV